MLSSLQRRATYQLPLLLPNQILALRDPGDPEFYPIANDEHFYLRVQVKDTGCGISPQDLPHLFTKFAHFQSGANKGCGGRGLGLAICKRFASLMEGRIWLESEVVGKGCTATFIVKLGATENSNGHLQQIVPVSGQVMEMQIFLGLDHSLKMRIGWLLPGFCTREVQEEKKLRFVEPIL